ncbi:MAG: tRNA-(ms[2]io[6]A)-hydroxylase [Pseudomonadota bacterium]
MRPSDVTDAVFAPEVPAAIASFLEVPSLLEWAEAAAADLPSLLIDHGNCELKAASTALALLHRYAQHEQLVWRMSRLAREELRHYEQVRKIARQMGITWRTLSASGYAAGLRAEVAGNDPDKLVDTLIVGALIEARSCERFAMIAPLLPENLAKFYRGLLASEARHFQDYLNLAEQIADTSIADRVDELRRAEHRLIASPATQIRFHSGPPIACNVVPIEQASRV